MLPADRRVRRPGDFSRVVRDGRRVGSSGVVLHLATGAGGDRPRVGFIVGRVVGNAVTRNRVRRQLRHLLAPRLADYPDGSMLVVRATAEAGKLTGARLAASIDTLSRRLLEPSAPRPTVGSR